ncbi:MAG: prepilin peptidase [Pseudomonadota bacterium]|nr:prepilin peptidase [Pseudomonadota bacterium]
MYGGASEILIAILAAGLLAAALVDLRTRTIPNALTLAVALLAIPFWWAAGLALWPEVALRVAVAAAVFALFTLFFLLRMMGGGDVKLAAAVALWLPAQAVLIMLVVMSIAGGVLTLAMLIRHRLARRETPLEIPYGVAIAFGGLWLISERFLNQFG